MTLSPRVMELLDRMTLEEKIGQVFVFTFVSQRQALNELRLHPGGFVRIYCDALTLARQTVELQATCKIPLIISADFERGIGSTVYGAVDIVGNMALGAADDEALTYEAARAIAQEARAIGVNMNYVPVVDVNTNPGNPIINVRAFGSDAALVARHGAAFVRGSHDGRVLTCAKHFPGHGDTATDSHTTLGAVTASRERLEEVELRPFREAISAGVDAVMSAHLKYPALDPDGWPATLSPRIMTGLLREELRFDGVAVSDALEMGAISRHFPSHEAVVKAFNAGIDQLLMPKDPARAVGHLRAAVEAGTISRARLDEAVGRILTMKERGGLFDAPSPDLASLPERLNTAEHRATAFRVAMRGTTLVRAEPNLLPLKPGCRTGVITFANDEDGRTYFTEPRSFAAHLEARLGSVKSVHCGQLDERAVHEFGAVEAARDIVLASDVVVVGAYTRVVINRGTADLEPRFSDFFSSLVSLGKPIVFVSFGNPYTVTQIRGAAAYVCAFGTSEAAQEATASLLCGEASFCGRLPVALKPAS
ncbi:MAG: glycoside hydrolase family 3 protein [Candidatus Sumerlaeaceae bacterium]|nr:glycoside hydrolase family 3 protein [Candidatus Sumerlaeaceae bacterium]